MSEILPRPSVSRFAFARILFVKLTLAAVVSTSLVAAAAEPPRVAGAIPLVALVRQDSIGAGKLVWAKVRVPADRVEVVRRQ